MGCDASCSSYADFDVEELGGAFFGWVFECDGPAGCSGCVAELVLVGGVVDFDDCAVGLVG